MGDLYQDDDPLITITLIKKIGLSSTWILTPSKLAHDPDFEPIQISISTMLSYVSMPATLEIRDINDSLVLKFTSPSEEGLRSWIKGEKVREKVKGRVKALVTPYFDIDIKKMVHKHKELAAIMFGEVEPKSAMFAAAYGSATNSLKEVLSSPQKTDTYPEWQPIETAPKDGTTFLGVCAGYHPDTGVSFMPGLAEWCDYGECWVGHDHNCEDDDHFGWALTHWMKLPPNPDGM